MSQAEMFPGVDGNEPISFRTPVNLDKVAAIENAFMAGLRMDAIIDFYGMEATSAALNNPVVAEVADPASNTTSEAADAA